MDQQCDQGVEVEVTWRPVYLCAALSISVLRQIEDWELLQKTTKKAGKAQDAETFTLLIFRTRINDFCACWLDPLQGLPYLLELNSIRKQSLAAHVSTLGTFLQASFERFYLFVFEKRYVLHYF